MRWPCALVLSGCFLSPIPDTRTPADFARAVEPKCRRDAGVEFVSADSIDSVDAATSFALGGPNGRQARLRGANIHLRPAPGQTPQTLARSLECHEASVVLGRTAGAPDDPFVLPGRWLAIDVESEGDGFVVRVTTDHLGDARRILERARRFAATRRQP